MDDKRRGNGYKKEEENKKKQLQKEKKEKAKTMRKVSFCTQTRDRQKQMTQLLYNNEHAQQDLVTRWKISGRRSKVILQESASDRRNIVPFTATTRHNEQHRD